MAFVDGEVIGKHEGIGALTVQLPLMVTTGPKTAGDGLDLSCVIDFHHDLVQLATSVILEFNDSSYSNALAMWAKQSISNALCNIYVLKDNDSSTNGNMRQGVKALIVDPDCRRRQSLARHLLTTSESPVFLNPDAPDTSSSLPQPSRHASHNKMELSLDTVAQQSCDLG